MMENENYHNQDDGTSILEPTEKDVLCGRGGMSNHHQGNEWYRRLIRSNRPLYRACPKHTKLLVSKAIVQAVEEQGGRFLERSRKTGLWYQVPYKRAVDKTSQGLRERDKDDASAPKITSLPASLRASNGGKIPKPNLSQLAQVTMQHAGMPLPSRKKQPPQSALKVAQQQHRQKQQKQARQMQQPIQQMPPQQQHMPQPQMPQSQMQPANRFSFSMGGSSNNNNNSGGGGGGPMGQVEPLDAPPPQPGLLSSQSSMFRLFSRFGGGGGGGGDNRRSSQTNDFGPPNQVPTVPSMSGPGITSFMGFGTSMVGNNMMDANNNNNNMGGGGMGGGMNMNAMNNAMNMNNNPMANMNNNPMNMNNNPMAMNNMSMNQQAQQQAFQQMQQQQQQQMQMQRQRQQQQANQGAGAPALTRLTTQMSDWLTSFWPVGKGGGNNNQGGNNRGNNNNRNNNNNNNMGQGGNNLDDFSGAAQMSQASFRGGNNDQSMQMNAMNAMQQQPNDMMAPMGRPSSGGGAMMDNNLGMPAPSAQMGGGRNSLRASVASNSNIAPPAGLESSVSTTLLRLASSPSKILGSISTFFSSDNQSATFPGPNEQQNQDDQIREPSPTFSDPSDPLMDGIPPPPPGGLGIPVVGRPSRRTSDLLDDYEETELEARMRAVAS